MQQRMSEREFQNLSKQILEDTWAFYPPRGSRLGLHDKYDGSLPDLSRGSIQKRTKQISERLGQLAMLDRSTLADEEQMNFRLIELSLMKEQFELRDLRIMETDPSVPINEFLNVVHYLNENYAPRNERIISLTRVITQIPDFLGEYAGQLQNEIALPVLENSIAKYEKLAEFYTRDLGDSVSDLPETVLLKNLDRARQQAAKAVNQFAGELRSRRRLASPEFSIGQAPYEKMLLYGDAVDLPLAHLISVGQRDLSRNLEEMKYVGAQFDPDRSGDGLRKLIESICEEHPSAQLLVADGGRPLEEIRRFILDQDLLTIPSEERCQVIEAPPYLRQTSFADMKPPGLLENRPGRAYYHITPVESQWTAQETEDWLRDFNYHTIHLFAIHEVYPGHFVHYLHHRRVPSFVRKALGSYTFLEGWAHYCEEMMITEGYGQNNPKLKLAQLRAALLRNCRFLCSIWMHTQGMTVDAATEFFKVNAFMGEFTARKEALRGTFDPGYLNYSLGKLMILKLRDDYRNEHADSFSLKEFHDQMLSFGSPPLPMVRQAMLENPGRLPI